MTVPSTVGAVYGRAFPEINEIRAVIRMHYFWHVRE
jgi:hypothetical protein